LQPIQNNKERKKKKREKKMKNKVKLLEAFAPGWGSDPTYDYPGSPLFNTEYYDSRGRDKNPISYKRGQSKSPIRNST